MLSFSSEDAFLAAFPASSQFIKANAADAPCVGIKVTSGRTADVSKAGWVAAWADITNPISSNAKLVLINAPIGECYACEIAPNGFPVGYTPRTMQNLGPVTAYQTRDPASPLLTFPVTSGTVRINNVEVGPGQRVFARLQDGTVGIVGEGVLAGMAVDTSGLFTAEAITYDSEAVWATEPLAADYEYEGLEGVKRAPSGSRLCFSETKNLYFVSAEKWAKMGYAPVA